MSGSEAVAAPAAAAPASTADAAAAEAPAAAAPAAVARPAVASPGSPARVQIEDNRRLRLSLHDTLEALLSLDRQSGGWLWRASGHTVQLESEASQALLVQARRTKGAELETVRFERQRIAAAIIHYCHLLRVPMPRGARKEIELGAEGAVLLLSLVVQGPRTRLASPPAPEPVPESLPQAAPEPAPESSSGATSAAAPEPVPEPAPVQATG